MRTQITRAQALALLQKYNREPFHIFHGLTVEGTMRYFAREMGENEDFWGLVGLLHDVDFEKYPEQHCLKAPELLSEIMCCAESTISGYRTGRRVPDIFVICHLSTIFGVTPNYFLGFTDEICPTHN